MHLLVPLPHVRRMHAVTAPHGTFFKRTQATDPESLPRNLAPWDRLAHSAAQDKVGVSSSLRACATARLHHLCIGLVGRKGILFWQHLIGKHLIRYPEMHTWPQGVGS